MVPDGIATVVVFGLLVAPGLSYQILADRRRPGVERSAFQEAGRTVLASAAFTAVAALLLAFAWNGVLTGVPEDPAWRDLLPVYAMVAATAGLACGLVLLLDRLRARGAPATIVERPSWHQVFRRDCPPGHIPVVRVVMQDGSWWTGRVSTYSTGDTGEDRELILHGRIRTSESPADDRVLAPQWERVVLTSSQIRTIQVAYPRR